MTPEIATDRLRLRAWLSTDREPFAALNADPLVMEHFPSTLSRDASDALADRIEAKFEQYGFGFWAVEIPGSATFAGFIGLSVPPFETHFTPCVEIGWRLASQYWDRGYATEGARAALRFGFEALRLKEIVAFTVPHNVRSRRVMEKTGMVRNPADDFDHPMIPDGHALRRHVLYRIRSQAPPNMSSLFPDFIRMVVDGDIDQISRRLAASPALATTSADEGATRWGSSSFFFADIAHYLYAGDTALHMAAAAFRRPVAEVLVAHGADCRAKNRRGAEPLHYAADANRWDPTAQAEMIEFLLSIGADSNAVDSAGVASLHRAVRTRSLAAVRALLDGGANARQPNKSGSTPLHLAVQDTGRGGSGSPQARDQQAHIVRLLLERGALVTDQDKRGRAVREAATTEWTRALLRKTDAG